jgi:hypothetical protein
MPAKAWTLSQGNRIQFTHPHNVSERANIILSLTSTSTSHKCSLPLSCSEHCTVLISHVFLKHYMPYTSHSSLIRHSNNSITITHSMVLPVGQPLRDFPTFYCSYPVPDQSSLYPPHSIVHRSTLVLSSRRRLIFLLVLCFSISRRNSRCIPPSCVLHVPLTSSSCTLRGTHLTKLLIMQFFPTSPQPYSVQIFSSAPYSQATLVNELSPEIWRRVIHWKAADVSEEHRVISNEEHSS